LNSEKIWKIWKKSMLNNEMIWKIWKKSWIVETVREKIQRGWEIREKSTWKKSGKSHVTSGHVTSGQACAMVRSSGSSSNNEWNLLYTTTVVSSHYVVEDCDKFVVRCRRLQYDPITISKFLLRLCNVFDRFPVLMYYWNVFCIKTEFRKSFFIKTL
jgi:hypothetical protein